MAYRLQYSDYAGNTASPSPPQPTPAPTGNGYRLRYSDYPGTAEGPPDPLRWVGPPGPQGPPGPAGPVSTYTLPTASTTILGGVKVDGSSITIAAGVISSAAAAAAVTSWNTRTGAVVLTSPDVTTALTFTPYNATNPSGFVNAAGAAAAAPVQSVATRTGAVVLTHTDITDWTATLAPYAPLASPTFTGTPTLPTGTIAVTQAPGTSNTTPATTAFVGAAVTAGTYTLPTASTTVLGGVKIDGTTVTIASGVITAALPVASSTLPVMDGTATIGIGTTWARADHIHPTDTSRYAASNPSGYQTAAQVTAVLPVVNTVTTPLMDGVAAIGTLTTYARPDHVHPTDTSRAPTASPTFTGTVTAAATNVGAFTATGITASPISGSTGSFTTLAASSTVSGTGFSTYLASPPAIGGTAAAAGAFTTLSASSTVSGTGFSTYLASPPAIGSTTASTGKFTTLAATGAATVGGTLGVTGVTTLSTGATSDPLTITVNSGSYARIHHTVTGVRDWSAGTWVDGSYRLTDETGATSRLMLDTAGLMTMTGAISVTGNLTTTGALSVPLPAAKTGTAYTLAATDCSLVLAPTGTFTLTLPAASASAGRLVRLKLTAAFAVNSASANVVPLVGGTASAAIMVATAGKFCLLQSDATSWQIMEAN